MLGALDFHDRFWSPLAHCLIIIIIINNNLWRRPPRQHTKRNDCLEQPSLKQKQYYFNARIHYQIIAAILCAEKSYRLHNIIVSKNISMQKLATKMKEIISVTAARSCLSRNCQKYIWTAKWSKYGVDLHQSSHISEMSLKFATRSRFHGTA